MNGDTVGQTHECAHIQTHARPITEGISLSLNALDKQYAKQNSILWKSNFKWPQKHVIVMDCSMLIGSWYRHIPTNGSVKMKLKCIVFKPSNLRIKYDSSDCCNSIEPFFAKDAKDDS